MLRNVVMLLVVGCVAMSLVSPAVAGEDMKHRIGLGVHYWQKVGDIELDSIEEDGFGWMITYQFQPTGIFRLEADIEQLPEHFGGLDKEVYAPQIYALAHVWVVYGGVGVGIYYSDGDFADDPFYVLRAGFDFPILPVIYADINVSYRFEEWGTFEGEDIDKDTLELGAALRLEL